MLFGTSQPNFSAPTSGAIKGILFFQDRSVPAGSAGSVINGNSLSTFDGALYFSTTQLTYNGNSSANGHTIIVADKWLINGNSQMGNNYSSLTNGSPIKGTNFGRMKTLGHRRISRHTLRRLCTERRARARSSSRSACLC
jgi:hypothetical protein